MTGATGAERSDGDHKAGERSPLQAAILGAAATGDTVDVRGWPEPDRRVGAGFLRLLYLGRHDVELDPRGPRLVGLIVDGDLDLRHATIDIPIRTRHCRLDGRLRLDHARARSLNLRWLAAAGPCTALHARIDGQLVLSAATLTNPDGEALSLDGAEVSGSVFLDDVSVSGQVGAVAADVGGQWSMNGATLANPNGAALVLDGAHISGGLFTHSGFNAPGEVRALGVRIAGTWAMNGATLTNPGGDALALDGADITGSVFLDGLNVRGEVRAVGARIGGQWSMMNGATLTNPDGTALSLHRAEITGGVFMREGFNATGAVRAIGAAVTGPWDMSGAALTTPGRIAVTLDRAEIAGDLHLDEITSSAPLSLVGTRVHGAAIDDPDHWPDGSLLDGFDYGLPAGLRPALWGADVRVAWLGRMAFSTQAYRHLADRYRQRGMPEAADTVMIAMRRRQRHLPPPPSLSLWSRLRRAARRCGDWLLDVTTGYGYRPTRIVVAAAVVLVATIGALSIGPVQNRLIAAGSGDRVWNANSVLVVPDPPPDPAPPPPAEGCTDDPVTTCFRPVLYAIDTVVPLVNLDQRATWHVDGAASWAAVVQFFLDAARLLGWLVAAAITFVVARHFQTRHG